jgi:hypothetical protein
MSTEYWVAIIGLLFSLINGLFFVFLSRTFKSMDKRSDLVDRSFETINNIVKSLEMKMQLFEHSLNDIKMSTKVGDDFKYMAQKAKDSADRAHQRLSEYMENHKEIKDMMAAQEKTIMKLNLVTEALQERLNRAKE